MIYRRNFDGGELSPAKRARFWPIRDGEMTTADGFENAEQRTDRRLLCSDLVTVRWIGAREFQREEVAVLEDYSKIGAGLFMPVRIDPGTTISVRTGWESIAAIVRHCSWRDDGYLLGIEFEQARDGEEVYVPEHLLDPADLEI